MGPKRSRRRPFQPRPELPDEHYPKPKAAAIEELTAAAGAEASATSEGIPYAGQRSFEDARFAPLLALCGEKHARGFAFLRVEEGQHVYRYLLNRRTLRLSLHQMAPYLRAYDSHTKEEMPPAVAVQALLV